MIKVMIEYFIVNDAIAKASLKVFPDGSSTQKEKLCALLSLETLKEGLHKGNIPIEEENILIKDILSKIGKK